MWGFSQRLFIKTALGARPNSALVCPGLGRGRQEGPLRSHQHMPPPPRGKSLAGSGSAPYFLDNNFGVGMRVDADRTQPCFVPDGGGANPCSVQSHFDLFGG